jgi:2-keto-4-pentenoate hydratase/2-oxohepta-3-ene-1,7-dioic acid hydratase in catechol pathway
MRYARFQQKGRPDVQYGWIEGDCVGLLEGTPFQPHRRQPPTLPLADVRLRAPVLPGKIICVGRNYLDHVQEHEAEVPAVPLLFMKPPSAVIGPDDFIVLPGASHQVEYEAELAVVIGAAMHHVAVEQAGRYILGYTAANDVTARDLQRLDGQWTRAKSFDTFCPLGPWIDTEMDPSDAPILCRVNGVMRQMAATKEMIFSVPRILAFISGIMTLDAGDVVLTGTPAGVGPLLPGDRVQVEIGGIGVLENVATDGSQDSNFDSGKGSPWKTQSEEEHGIKSGRLD